ncbi:hypothetical protein B0H10DRAFT_2319721 [Mycena sp. CBHHK59/15]|nr:hypothetical protein B0H10DRAFT_2319721 [Mycena sp. CBHHK59/15]
MDLGRPFGASDQTLRSICEPRLPEDSKDHINTRTQSIPARTLQPGLPPAILPRTVDLPDPAAALPMLSDCDAFQPSIAVPHVCEADNGLCSILNCPTIVPSLLCNMYYELTYGSLGVVRRPRLPNADEVLFYYWNAYHKFIHESLGAVCSRLLHTAISNSIEWRGTILATVQRIGSFSAVEMRSTCVDPIALRVDGEHGFPHPSLSSSRPPGKRIAAIVFPPSAHACLMPFTRRLCTRRLYRRPKTMRCHGGTSEQCTRADKAPPHLRPVVQNHASKALLRGRHNPPAAASRVWHNVRGFKVYLRRSSIDRVLAFCEAHAGLPVCGEDISTRTPHSTSANIFPHRRWLPQTHQPGDHETRCNRLPIVVVDLVRGGKEKEKEKEKEKKEKKESERRERESRQTSEGRRRTPLSDAFPGMSASLVDVAAFVGGGEDAVGPRLERVADAGSPAPASGLGGHAPCPRGLKIRRRTVSVLTLLDAATNDLAQLITHLDLEATPGTPTPAKGPIVPRKEWEDSPTGKSKTLRPSMGSVISLRPYAQLRALTNAASRHDWMADGQHVSASCVPARALRGDVPAPPHDDAVPEPEPAPIFQPLHLRSRLPCSPSVL